MSLNKKLINNKIKPIYKLLYSYKQTAGKNNLGQIVVRFRGGGHKKYYRIIDYQRKLDFVPAIIRRKEYDPIKRGYLFLVCYFNGVLSYILAVVGLNVGDVILSGSGISGTIGNALPLIEMPIGSLVHNIEMKLQFGGQYCRAFGSFGQILKNWKGYVLIRFSSGQQRWIFGLCRATLGISLFTVKQLKYKAGQSRWLGIRPRVRGESMNPVDHPHGGRTRGGRPSVSLWGQLAKGYKTKHKKRKIKEFNV